MALKAYVVLRGGVYLSGSMTAIADKAHSMARRCNGEVRAVSLSSHEIKNADLSGYAAFVAGGRVLPETYRATEHGAMSATKLLRLGYAPPIRRVYGMLRKQLGRG